MLKQQGKQRRITGRDIWTLEWIAQQYAVRYDQLQRLLSRDPGSKNGLMPGPKGVSNSAVNQVITRWLSPPALIRYDRSFRPGWIQTTKETEKSLLGLPYSPHLLKESRHIHRYYINKVRLNYESRHPDHLWTSERALVHQAEDGRVHRPDAIITRDNGQRIAVEVELMPKPTSEIQEIMMTQLTEFDGIWYFVSDATPAYKTTWRNVVASQQLLSPEWQRRVQTIDLTKVGS